MRIHTLIDDDGASVSDTLLNPPLLNYLLDLPPYTEYETGWSEYKNYNPYIDDAYDSRLAYNGEDAEIDIVAENLRQVL